MIGVTMEAEGGRLNDLNSKTWRLNNLGTTQMQEQW